MEDDAYSVFLAQASRAARLEADPAAEEYIDPIRRRPPRAARAGKQSRAG